ncbi:MAG: SurA N-terminal domain-containing protein, partial [Verrucomicrobiae bacterium]|nr:SurA N-terminal domain-containing protein [Verrucomicrobiae bacterium]
MHKLFRTLLAIALATAATEPCLPEAATSNVPPSPTSGAEVVARVGDAVISRRELDMAMIGVLAQIQRQGRTVTPEQRRQLEYGVLNSLIDREVVLQSARPNPPADLAERTKAHWNNACTQAGGEDMLLKALQEAGISREEFEQRTRENIIVGEALRQVAETHATVTPDEIKEFYESNRARMKQPELVRVSHILVRIHPEATDDIKKACRTKINVARSLILAGEKFADIARSVSDDPQTAPTGG